MENVITLVSLLLNVVFGAGLFATVKQIKTLKHDVTKAGAEAEGAKAEAKSKEIDNEEKILKLNQEYVVEPLKKEIARFSRIITRFEKAFEKVKECEYKEECPVRREFQKREDEQ